MEQMRSAIAPTKSSRNTQAKVRASDLVKCPSIITELPPGGPPRYYVRGRYLGRGGFSLCYQVEDQDTGQALAAKVISKAILHKARSRAKLRSEITIHSTLAHPCVVKFERCFEDDHNIYIVLELCAQQTLAELLKARKHLTEAEVAKYLRQAVTGLQHLHARGIIHRDLKLGNLFLSSRGALKIGDFGLACKLAYEGERKTTMCGTPNYIAPEVLCSPVGHSFEVDVWSLGVVAFALLLGRPPFETSDVDATYQRIKNNIYDFPAHVSVSDEAKSLIRALLSTNPADRPTLKEFLSHPFIQTHAPDFPPPAACPASPPPATLPHSLSLPSPLKTQRKASCHPMIDSSRPTSTHPTVGGATASAHSELSAYKPSLSGAGHSENRRYGRAPREAESQKSRARALHFPGPTSDAANLQHRPELHLIVSHEASGAPKGMETSPCTPVDVTPASTCTGTLSHDTTAATASPSPRVPSGPGLSQAGSCAHAGEWGGELRPEADADSPLLHLSHPPRRLTPHSEGGACGWSTGRCAGGQLSPRSAPLKAPPPCNHCPVPTPPSSTRRAARPNRRLVHSSACAEAALSAPCSPSHPPVQGQDSVRGQAPPRVPRDAEVLQRPTSAAGPSKPRPAGLGVGASRPAGLGVGASRPAGLGVGASRPAGLGVGVSSERDAAAQTETVSASLPGATPSRREETRQGERERAEGGETRTNCAGTTLRAGTRSSTTVPGAVRVEAEATVTRPVQISDALYGPYSTHPNTTSVPPADEVSDSSPGLMLPMTDASSSRDMRANTPQCSPSLGSHQQHKASIDACKDTPGADRLLLAEHRTTSVPGPTARSAPTANASPQHVSMAARVSATPGDTPSGAVPTSLPCEPPPAVIEGYGTSMEKIKTMKDAGAGKWMPQADSSDGLPLSPAIGADCSGAVKKRHTSACELNLERGRLGGLGHERLIPGNEAAALSAGASAATTDASARPQNGAGILGSDARARPELSRVRTQHTRRVGEPEQEPSSTSYAALAAATSDPCMMPKGKVEVLHLASGVKLGDGLCSKETAHVHCRAGASAASVGAGQSAASTSRDVSDRDQVAATETAMCHRLASSESRSDSIHRSRGADNRLESAEQWDGAGAESAAQSGDPPSTSKSTTGVPAGAKGSVVRRDADRNVAAGDVGVPTSKQDIVRMPEAARVIEREHCVLIREDASTADIRQSRLHGSDPNCAVENEGFLYADDEVHHSMVQERLSASSNAASRCTSQATGTADSLHSFVDPFCFEHMGSGLIYPDRAPPGTCDKTAAALPAGQRAGDVQLSGTGASGVWVLKWVDYSCKYGLGYEMSDGGCGVVFNDGSKLIQSHSGERVEYREHERQDTSQAADPVQVLTGSASHPMAVPEKLRKKMAILGHFSTYMQKNGSCRSSCVLVAAPTDQSPSKCVYVKKWMKTPHAIIFRLSNKTIQVHFNDATEIVLSSDTRSVTYVNKDLFRTSHPLSNLPEDPDLVQRLKYTKGVLMKLVSRSR